jgi:aminopeptidase N
MSTDDAFKAFMLQLPSESEIAAIIGTDVDAEAIHGSRTSILSTIAALIGNELRATIARCEDHGSYSLDPAATGRRSLRYAALALLACAEPEMACQIAIADFSKAANMTAELGALASLLHTADPRVDEMLARFYDRHHQDHLLVDKWFMLQAQRTGPSACTHIAELTRHKDFHFETPNRVYALLATFPSSNPSAFHAADGSGYDLLSKAIMTVDPISPQVAARLATSFRNWKIFDQPRRMKAREHMESTLSRSSLSRDVYEIISRTLGP